MYCFRRTMRLVTLRLKRRYLTPLELQCDLHVLYLAVRDGNLTSAIRRLRLLIIRLRRERRNFSH